MAATSNSHKIKQDPLYERLSACRIDLEDDRRGIYNSAVETADKHLKDLFQKYAKTSAAIQQEIDNLKDDQNIDRITLTKKLFEVGRSSYHEIFAHLSATAKALTLFENPNASQEQIAFRLDCVCELNQPEIKASYLTIIRNKTVEAAKIITKLSNEKVTESLPLIIQSQHLVEMQKNGGFHFGNPHEKGYKVSKEYTSAQSSVKYYEITTEDKTKTSAVFPNSIPDLDTLIKLVQNSSVIARSANQRLSKIELNGSPLYIVSYEQGIRITSVFPVFYFHEFASENKESISFIEGSDKQYSSEELGHAAIKVILDFSNEVEKLHSEKTVIQSEIDMQKAEIDQKILVETDRIIAMKAFEAIGNTVVAKTIPKFQVPISRRKAKALEKESKGLSSKLSPLNEKRSTLCKDNPVHFCDEKYVYVDLAVSWQTNPNEEPYQSRISNDLDIHRGILLRISITDPILQSADIQSAIGKLKSLH